MDEVESLSHTKWECKYHVVFHSRNVGARRCTKNCGGIWGKCSESWPSQRKVKSRKGLCGRIMCTG